MVCLDLNFANTAVPSLQDLDDDLDFLDDNDSADDFMETVRRKAAQERMFSLAKPYADDETTAITNDTKSSNKYAWE